MANTFKADLNYSDQEKTLMEDITAKEITETKAALAKEKYYILKEIAHNNITFLQSLSIEKKRNMIDAITKMWTEAKSSFDKYTKRLGLTDYSTRDEKTIWSRDAGFRVAVAQALTINCCNQEENLSTGVVTRAKNPKSVDGRFGPNTLFAMNEVFRWWDYFPGEKFNGLLQDGADATTLLDKLIEHAGEWTTNTWSLDDENKTILSEIVTKRTDYVSDNKLSAKIKELLAADKKGIGDYIRSLWKDKDSEAKTTTNLYIQRELLALLADEAIWKDNSKNKSEFIKELSKYFTNPDHEITKKLNTIKTVFTENTTNMTPSSKEEALKNPSKYNLKATDNNANLQPADGYIWVDKNDKSNFAVKKVETDSKKKESTAKEKELVKQKAKEATAKKTTETEKEKKAKENTTDTPKVANDTTTTVTVDDDGTWWDV